MKHIGSILSSILLALTIPAVAHAMEDYAHCKTIITDGLREIDIETSSFAYLNTVFDKYCESSGVARESSFNAGLSVVVDAIPNKFTLGSSDKNQSMRNFCKEYQSYSAGRNDSFRRKEKIVTRAYDSFDACVGLAAQGVKLSHKIRSLEFLDFFLSPSLGRPVIMNGIQTSGNIECRGKNSDSLSKNALIFDVNTRVIVKDTPLNIVCRRTGKPSKKGTVYEEGVVTLLTDIQSYGNYGVVLPRDTRLAENKASELNVMLDNQARTIEMLRKNISALSSPVAVAQDIGYSAARGGGSGAMTMSSLCPANQVVIGVEIIVGGTCHGQCDLDGGTLHKFRVKCAPRHNALSQ